MGRRAKYNPSTDLGPRGGLRSPDVPRRFIQPDTPSPPPLHLPPNERAESHDDDDPTTFHCPNCTTRISITMISEHVHLCRPSGVSTSPIKLTRKSVLTRRPLMGSSTIISGAGPGPSTLALRAGAQPGLKRQRLDAEGGFLIRGCDEIIELSAEDEAGGFTVPTPSSFQFFKDDSVLPPVHQRGRFTPPPPYLG
jgi:hypothetical protein